jgi:2-hydroxy-3-keto-5-methylthiopentenyl-1-phosphate phosphatase
VTLVSDGFGFYIRPLLEAAGLERLGVLSNVARFDGGGPSLERPHAHPECVACGTCKMNAVLSARELGAVAFVGEGQSDRYGAIYADVVFAKDALVGIARTDGVPFLRWETFEDVRTGLQALGTIPGPVGRERCPGWRTP